MNASIAPITAADPAADARDSHRAMLPGARVLLDASTCLPQRFPANPCTLCVDACPLALLEADGRAPRLRQQAATAADACIGCGQCAATCPTGALHVDGFALPVELPDEPELLVDCWRVPAAESPAGTLRVPCLGGLSSGWLLSLFDAAGERPIRLLDRGHCDECPAGDGIRNLLAAITEARLLMFGCGVDIGLIPMLVWRPCNTPLLPAIPERSAETPIARRGFFRSMFGAGARAVDQVRSPVDTTPVTLRTTMQPLQRLRLTSALTRIAQRHGLPVPARAMPRLSLGECCAHGVCARVCPTGALQQVTSAGMVELRFSAARCISCNQCLRVCPERALRLDAEGGSVTTEVLQRWRQNECASCGADYPNPAVTPELAVAGTCPACSKAEQLTRGVADFLRAPVVSDVSQP